MWSPLSHKMMLVRVVLPSLSEWLPGQAAALRAGGWGWLQSCFYCFLLFLLMRSMSSSAVGGLCPSGGYTTYALCTQQYCSDELVF